MKSVCLWDVHNVIAAEWWWWWGGGCAPSAFWGLRQCFLMEVSPAHCQFPFTKCQGSSPVIVSTTKCPYTFPAPSVPLRTSVMESRPEPSDSVLEDILEASGSMFICGEEKIEAKRNEVAFLRKGAFLLSFLSSASICSLESLFPGALLLPIEWF